MTHTQQHGLYGQTEAMTRQNHKYSLKLVMNAQHLSNGKRSDKNFRSLGCAYLPMSLNVHNPTQPSLKQYINMGHP